jgi:SAM-dependent methyltransferase
MSGPNVSEAHATWADVYDEIYAQSFGEFYSRLTSTTLETIRGLVKPGARILDFGAGTGRLAVPLAMRGHHVTAVEPSGAMLRVLLRKAAAAGVALDTVEAKMGDYKGDGSFDFATSVFTVIAYVLTEEELLASFQAAASCLRSGGRFLVDVPGLAIFASDVRENDKVKRRVSVTPDLGDVFTYEGNTRVLWEGRWVEVRDRFPIRYWPPAVVQEFLAKAGFKLEQDFSRTLSFSGAQYWCYRKD